MTYELNVKYEDGIVFAYMKGEDTYQAGFEIWTEIITLCNKHSCFKILGVQKMTPLKITEAYDNEKIFREVGLSMKYHIAWVEEENPETREMLEYSAAILRNRRLLNGGIFQNTAAAKKWLLDQ